VLDDGNRVGRIRDATESNSHDKWFWVHQTVLPHRAREPARLGAVGG
jgi:hypothetical protein